MSDINNVVLHNLALGPFYDGVSSLMALQSDCQDKIFLQLSEMCSIPLVVFSVVGFNCCGEVHMLLSTFVEVLR